MVITDVLQELINKGYLNQKQLFILNSLLMHKLTAKEISKKTKIPLGRIYEHLNFLIESKLIEKKGKKPCLYIFDDPKERVIVFMKSKFDTLLNDKNKIIDLIDEKSQPRVTFLKSSEDFTFTLIKLLITTQDGLKTIARYGSLPFTFYPKNKDAFVKMREAITKERSTIAKTTKTKAILVYEAYKKAYEEGKTFFGICNKKTFIWHLKCIKDNLGKEFLDYVIKDFRTKVRENKIRLYISEDYLPMQIFIIHDRVVLFHVHKGIRTGIEIEHDVISDLYDGMYNDMMKRAKSAEYYLRKMNL